MQIVEDYSLKTLNTFGLDIVAKKYYELNTKDDLQSIMQSAHWDENTLILGGGSNILFTRNVDGLVIKNNLLGIGITKENENYAWLCVKAGENWHTLVLFCLEV